MYIDKKFLLQVYKHLATMHQKPQDQGARQKVSAIKYFLAADAFIARHSRDCDLKKKDSDATEFIDYVGAVVEVNDSEYTRDFYTPLLRDSRDYDVGSNFYSAGVVNDSKNNKARIFRYPRRGNSPIMEIQDRVLSLQENHYSNFSTAYLSTPSIASCLLIWLCRKTNFATISENFINQCLQKLEGHYTHKLIETFKEAIGEERISWLEEILNCKLLGSNSYELIEGNDITSLWNIVQKLPDATPVKNAVSVFNATALRDSDAHKNKIYFGAPGTGKSYQLNLDASKLKQDNIERVTFYPSYSYAQFVGTYKPTVKSEEDKDGKNQDVITYGFVPGPFLRMLGKAINNNEEDFLIIIEEINRANAAAVFGDVFQLLDRTKNGDSEYPVALSEDMRHYLLDQEIDLDNLTLPPNLYIWATMNSADQGVFPMDTAFKRRWEFEYLDIDANEQVIDGYDFPFKDGNYEWNTLRKAINEQLLNARVNEDKLLGPFFIKLETIADETNEPFLQAFKSKVLMYLFEDAIRHNPMAIFNDGLTSYSKICKKLDEEGIAGIFRFPIPKYVENREDGNSGEESK